MVRFTRKVGGKRHKRVGMSYKKISSSQNDPRWNEA